LQIKTKIVSCHTADSKPVKQEVNSTVILPHLIFPDESKKQTLTEFHLNDFLGCQKFFKVNLKKMLILEIFLEKELSMFEGCDRQHDKLNIYIFVCVSICIVAK